MGDGKVKNNIEEWVPLGGLYDELWQESIPFSQTTVFTSSEQGTTLSKDKASVHLKEGEGLTAFKNLKKDFQGGVKKFKDAYEYIRDWRIHDEEFEDEQLRNFEVGLIIFQEYLSKTFEKEALKEKIASKVGKAHRIIDAIEKNNWIRLVREMKRSSGEKRSNIREIARFIERLAKMNREEFLAKLGESIKWTERCRKRDEVLGAIVDAVWEKIYLVHHPEVAEFKAIAKDIIKKIVFQYYTGERDLDKIKMELKKLNELHLFYRSIKNFRKEVLEGIIIPQYEVHWTRGKKDLLAKLEERFIEALKNRDWEEVKRVEADFIAVREFCEALIAKKALYDRLKKSVHPDAKHLLCDYNDPETPLDPISNEVLNSHPLPQACKKILQKIEDEGSASTMAKKMALQESVYWVESEDENEYISILSGETKTNLADIIDEVDGFKPFEFLYEVGKIGDPYDNVGNPYSILASYVNKGRDHAERLSPILEEFSKVPYGIPAIFHERAVVGLNAISETGRYVLYAEQKSGGETPPDYAQRVEEALKRLQLAQREMEELKGVVEKNSYLVPLMMAGEGFSYHELAYVNAEAILSGEGFSDACKDAFRELIGGETRPSDFGGSIGYYNNQDKVGCTDECEGAPDRIPEHYYMGELVRLLGAPQEERLNEPDWLRGAARAIKKAEQLKLRYKLAKVIWNTREKGSFWDWGHRVGMNLDDEDWEKSVKALAYWKRKERESENITATDIANYIAGASVNSPEGGTNRNIVPLIKERIAFLEMQIKVLKEAGHGELRFNHFFQLDLLNISEGKPEFSPKKIIDNMMNRKKRGYVDGEYYVSTWVLEKLLTEYKDALGSLPERQTAKFNELEASPLLASVMDRVTDVEGAQRMRQFSTALMTTGTTMTGALVLRSLSTLGVGPEIAQTIWGGRTIFAAELGFFTAGGAVMNHNLDGVPYLPYSAPLENVIYYAEDLVWGAITLGTFHKAEKVAGKYLQKAMGAWAEKRLIRQGLIQGGKQLSVGEKMLVRNAANGWMMEDVNRFVPRHLSFLGATGIHARATGLRGAALGAGMVGLDLAQNSYYGIKRGDYEAPLHAAEQLATDDSMLHIGWRVLELMAVGIVSRPITKPLVYKTQVARNKLFQKYQSEIRFKSAEHQLARNKFENLGKRVQMGGGEIGELEEAAGLMTAKFEEVLRAEEGLALKFPEAVERENLELHRQLLDAEREQAEGLIKMISVVMQGNEFGVVRAGGLRAPGFVERAAEIPIYEYNGTSEEGLMKRLGEMPGRVRRVEAKTGNMIVVELDVGEITVPSMIFRERAESGVPSREKVVGDLQEIFDDFGSQASNRSLEDFDSGTLFGLWKILKPVKNVAERLASDKLALEADKERYRESCQREGGENAAEALAAWQGQIESRERFLEGQEARYRAAVAAANELLEEDGHVIFIDGATLRPAVLSVQETPIEDIGRRNRSNYGLRTPVKNKTTAEMKKLKAEIERAYENQTNVPIKNGLAGLETSEMKRLEAVLRVIVDNARAEGKRKLDVCIAGVGPSDPHAVRILKELDREFGDIDIYIYFREAEVEIGAFRLFHEDLVETDKLRYQAVDTDTGREHSTEYDLVYWSFPSPNMRIETLTQNLKEGGYFILGSELEEALVVPLVRRSEFEVLMDRRTTRSDYLVPGEHLERGASRYSKEVILRKKVQVAGLAVTKELGVTTGKPEWNSEPPDVFLVNMATKEKTKVPEDGILGKEAALLTNMGAEGVLVEGNGRDIALNGEVMPYGIMVPVISGDMLTIEGRDYTLDYRGEGLQFLGKDRIRLRYGRVVSIREVYERLPNWLHRCILWNIAEAQTPQMLKKNLETFQRALSRRAPVIDAIVDVFNGRAGINDARNEIPPVLRDVIERYLEHMIERTDSTGRVRKWAYKWFMLILPEEVSDVQKEYIASMVGNDFIARVMKSDDIEGLLHEITDPKFLGGTNGKKREATAADEIEYYYREAVEIEALVQQIRGARRDGPQQIPPDFYLRHRVRDITGRYEGEEKAVEDSEVGGKEIERAEKEFLDRQKAIEEELKGTHDAAQVHPGLGTVRLVREKSRLGRRLRGAVERSRSFAELDSLLKRLAGGENRKTINNLRKVISDVAVGRAPLSFVPPEFELQGRVAEFMWDEVRGLSVEERHLAGKMFPSGAEDALSHQSRLQFEYLALMAARALKAAVERAGSIYELEKIIKDEYYGFRYFDYENAYRLSEFKKSLTKPVQYNWLNITPEFGIRQKALDLYERGYFQTRRLIYYPEVGYVSPFLDRNPALNKTALELEREKRSLYEGISWVAGRCRGDGAYYSTRVADVLEGDAPLIHIPVEVIGDEGGWNLRTAARKIMFKTISFARMHFPQATKDWDEVREGDKSSDYRQDELLRQYHEARRLLYSQTGRTSLSYPSSERMERLVVLVRRHFDSGVQDYFEAQEVVRHNAERLTGRFERFIGAKEITHAEKAILIEALFGAAGVRYFENPAVAGRISEMIGAAGFYREIAFSPDERALFAAIRLGYMTSAKSEYPSGVPLHTHPPQFLSENGIVVAIWGNGDELDRIVVAGPGDAGQEKEVVSQPKEVLDLEKGESSYLFEHQLFSAVDIESSEKTAKWHFENLGRVEHRRNGFNPETLTLTEWIRTPFGISRMRVALNEAGEVDYVLVDIGLKPGIAGNGIETNGEVLGQLRGGAFKRGTWLSFREVGFAGLKGEYDDSMDAMDRSKHYNLESAKRHAEKVDFSMRGKGPLLQKAAESPYGGPPLVGEIIEALEEASAGDLNAQARLFGLKNRIASADEIRELLAKLLGMEKKWDGVICNFVIALLVYSAEKDFSGVVGAGMVQGLRARAETLGTKQRERLLKVLQDSLPKSEEDIAAEKYKAAMWLAEEWSIGHNLEYEPNVSQREVAILLRGVTWKRIGEFYSLPAGLRDKRGPIDIDDFYELADRIDISPEEMALVAGMGPEFYRWARDCLLDEDIGISSVIISRFAGESRNHREDVPKTLRAYADEIIVYFSHIFDNATPQHLYTDDFLDVAVLLLAYVTEKNFNDGGREVVEYVKGAILEGREVRLMILPDVGENFGVRELLEDTTLLFELRSAKAAKAIFEPLVPGAGDSVETRRGKVEFLLSLEWVKNGDVRDMVLKRSYAYEFLHNACLRGLSGDTALSAEELLPSLGFLKIFERNFHAHRQELVDEGYLEEVFVLDLLIEKFVRVLPELDAVRVREVIIDEMGMGELIGFVFGMAERTGEVHVIKLLEILDAGGETVTKAEELFSDKKFKRSNDFKRGLLAWMDILGRLKGADALYLEELFRALPDPKSGEREEINVFFQLFTELRAFPGFALEAVRGARESGLQGGEAVERLGRIYHEKLSAHTKELFGLSEAETRRLSESLSRDAAFWGRRSLLKYLLLQGGFSSDAGKRAIRDLIRGIMAGEITGDMVGLKMRYDYLRRVFPGGVVDRWSENRVYSGKELEGEQENPENLARQLLRDTRHAVLGHLGIDISGGRGMDEDHYKTLLRANATNADLGDVHENNRLKVAAENLGSLLYQFGLEAKKDRPDPKTFQKRVEKLTQYIRKNRDILTEKGASFLVDVLPVLENFIKDMNVFSAAAAEEEVRVRITDDAADMMVRGLFPVKTCQRPHEATGHNERGEIVNPILYGQFKMAVVEVKRGDRWIIKARMLIEITKDADESAAVLGDNIYSAGTQYALLLRRGVRRFASDQLGLKEEDVYLLFDVEDTEAVPLPIDVGAIVGEGEIYIYRDSGIGAEEVGFLEENLPEEAKPKNIGKDEMDSRKALLREIFGTDERDTVLSQAGGLEELDKAVEEDDTQKILLALNNFMGNRCQTAHLLGLGEVEMEDAVKLPSFVLRLESAKRLVETVEKSPWLQEVFEGSPARKWAYDNIEKGLKLYEEHGAVDLHGGFGGFDVRGALESLLKFFEAPERSAEETPIGKKPVAGIYSKYPQMPRARKRTGRAEMSRDRTLVQPDPGTGTKYGNALFEIVANLYDHMNLRIQRDVTWGEWVGAFQEYQEARRKGADVEGGITAATKYLAMATRGGDARVSEYLRMFGEIFKKDMPLLIAVRRDFVEKYEAEIEVDFPEALEVKIEEGVMGVEELIREADSYSTGVEAGAKVNVVLGAQSEFELIDHLLERGEKVVAVNRSPRALEHLSKYFAEAVGGGRLVIKHENYVGIPREGTIKGDRVFIVYPDDGLVYSNFSKYLLPGGVVIVQSSAQVGGVKFFERNIDRLEKILPKGFAVKSRFIGRPPIWTWYSETLFPANNPVMIIGETGGEGVPSVGPVFEFLEGFERGGTVYVDPAEAEGHIEEGDQQGAGGTVFVDGDSLLFSQPPRKQGAGGKVSGIDIFGKK